MTNRVYGHFHTCTEALALRVAVAQEVEVGGSIPDSSRLLQLACGSVLGQDTEPQIAPNGSFIGL